MRVVVQRVKHAKVTVDKEIQGEIQQGLLVFLGIAKGDGFAEADYLINKIVNLRVFVDSNQKMNLSLLDLKLDILLVSQFTIYGDCSKGRRPSFFAAETPKKAEVIYDYFADKLAETGLKLEQGEFQAMMEVELINDGPVTLIIESKDMR